MKEAVAEMLAKSEVHQGLAGPGDQCLPLSRQSTAAAEVQAGLVRLTHALSLRTCKQRRTGSGGTFQPGLWCSGSRLWPTGCLLLFADPFLT